MGFWRRKKNSAKFGEKWPKIWPTCIFRPGKSLDGLKSDFGERKINLAKFDGKWPKMWPTCIVRPKEGSEGLKSDLGRKNEFGQIW